MTAASPPRLVRWNGQEPQRLVTLKIDGVQARLVDGRVVSRSGKPLHNVNPEYLQEGRAYELYDGSFSSTVSRARSFEAPLFLPSHVWEIWPGTDARLVMPLAGVQTVGVQAAFEWAVLHGFEGLVIDQRYKMKPVQTYDVPVLEVVPGNGKHAGRMGALVTPRGNVGTGFTDAQREEPWVPGELIEVSAMSLTDDGQFRHPRFVRRRWDKPTEEADVS